MNNMGKHDNCLEGDKFKTPSSTDLTYHKSLMSKYLVCE